MTKETRTGSNHGAIKCSSMIKFVKFQERENTLSKTCEHIIQFQHDGVETI